MDGRSGDDWEPRSAAGMSAAKLADIPPGNQYLKANRSIGETYTACFCHKTAIEME
jgi:hypothetical protein